jgi:DNA-binding transcriptional MerR regulator
MTVSQRTFTMAHLTKEFDVSSRTIRFYEEKGLISPKRTKGNQRRYTTKDRFRLKWILRGRRFGYSLHEISKILSMTETSAGEAQQIITTLEYGEKKLQDIESHIQELQIMKKEMLRLKEKLLQRLAELEQEKT